MAIKKAKTNVDAVEDPQRKRRTARGELFCLRARNGEPSSAARGKKLAVAVASKAFEPKAVLA
jgi:hypothetical protein